MHHQECNCLDCLILKQGQMQFNEHDPVGPYEIKNSTEWPNVFSCRFLEDGIVSYKDSDAGIAYLSNEAIKKMSPSFIGKPVCVNHQKITSGNYENMRREGTIVGNVTRVWFNSTDGWWWCDFIVDSQKARDRINNNKDKVSCAYTVKSTKKGGLWHDIPYDAEITDGEFTHLAIVENPRYEGATITKQLPAMLVNEKAAFIFKNKEDQKMFKFFKTNKEGVKKEISPTVVLKNAKGEEKEYNLSDLMQLLFNEKIEKGVLIEPKEPMKGVHAQPDSLIDINGHAYKVNDLQAMLKNWKPEEKHNCSCGAEEGKEHKEDCKMSKKNSKPTAEEEAAAKKAEEEKLNAKKKEEEEILNAAKKKDAAKEKIGMEFFDALNSLANSANLDLSMPGDKPALTREERANKKREAVAAAFKK